MLNPLKDTFEPETLGLVKVVNYAKEAAARLIPQNVTIPPPEVVYQQGDITLFTKKSISLLIARAKAGKTTVAAWIIAQVIQNDIKVLWIDTEQGLYYGSRTQSWILQIAGISTSDCLRFYDLKIYNPRERILLIEALIQAGDFDLIVIDGVRDLVFDINNPEEATNIATSLMRWAEINNTHVLTILHQNKGDGHARGHLGSEMVNKAETVIKVSQNEANEIIVEPEFTRSKPFQPFALCRDDRDLPQLIEGWTNISTVQGKTGRLSDPIEFPESTHLEALRKIFSASDQLTSGDFQSGLMAAWSTIGGEMKLTRAKTFRSYYVQQGLIDELPNQKGNRTLNQLNEKYRVS